MSLMTADIFYIGVIKHDSLIRLLKGPFVSYADALEILWAECKDWKETKCSLEIVKTTQTFERM